MTTSTHEPRIDYARTAREPIRAMIRLERAVASSLDRALYELVKVRASQINGCAYCLHMHTRDARAAGVAQLKLDVLAAWRESPAFDARERAALAFAEALTLVSEQGLPDDVWQGAAEQFDDDELGALVFGVVAINGWNRIAIARGAPHELETG